jgi:DNA-binding transcriptional MocR family regulator
MKGFPLQKWWAFQLVQIDNRLTPRAKLCFGRLLEYHNTITGACFPSEATLARDLSCSARSVRSAIKELKILGYVKVVRRLCNHYELALPSGKYEYQEAAKSVLQNRKKPASKPKKEP